MREQVRGTGGRCDGHRALGTADATCYAHVVRRVREITSCALPENYAAAACSPEQWAFDIGGEVPVAGDVVEMRGGGHEGERHVGVMLDRFTMEHFDRKAGEHGAITRVPLAVVKTSGTLVRMMRPFRKAKTQ